MFHRIIWYSHRVRIFYLRIGIFFLRMILNRHKDEVKSALQKMVRNAPKLYGFILFLPVFAQKYTIFDVK